MPNSTELRRILVNSIVSVDDGNNVSEDLGFKHTINGSLKPYNLHLTSSLSTRFNDVLSHNHIKTLFEDKREFLDTDAPVINDSTKQVYNINVPANFQIATGSVTFKINGLEQQTTEDQKTDRDVGTDYFLSGSRFEQLVLYKPRADHSGLAVDNQDTLLIKYRVEKIIG
mgnify:CR=1 FL=1|tara:strand:+ start:5592 stop:6101 length:510 start_codon:yes stop_codon:yes gene_type:complete